MSDFLSFRRMLAPLVIQAGYWIGTFAILLVGLITILNADGGAGVFGGILILILGPIGVRLYCELMILFFRMNETLTDIHAELRANNSGHVPYQSPVSGYATASPSYGGAYPVTAHTQVAQHPVAATNWGPPTSQNHP